MKIYFERSGGFAGIKMSTSIDTSLLDKDEADKIEEIVNNSQFFTLDPKIAGPKTGADFFNYKITIESEDRKRTLETSDMTLPSEIGPLLRILKDKATQ